MRSLLSLLSWEVSLQLLTTLTLADFELPLDLVQYHPAMNPLLKEEIDSEGLLLTTTDA